MTSYRKANAVLGVDSVVLVPFFSVPSPTKNSWPPTSMLTCAWKTTKPATTASSVHTQCMREDGSHLGP